MWTREVDGLRLTFHLAGINNQNFLMRDEETGTYWQQITGLAVSGPLAGRRLTLVPSDELTFATWKAEEPHGTVLRDVPAFASGYAPADWDVQMKRAPTVLSYAEPGLTPRDLMVGVQAFGAARAFPYDLLLKQRLVEDRVGAEPVMLVVGADGRSLRMFRRRLPAATEPPEFYRVVDQKPGDGALFMDASTGSRWDFHGCAIAGKLTGTCLDRVEIIKDYWFDWRHYHPDTTVYGRSGK